ncbi:nuclease-related domain-containing protein [Caballeronia concitans]|uniref:NERD domain-containing protein n=1 Tax=Caballeronia concitans TaxID=1777133 RepID=A0A658QZ64_9BURK|nr:nuclease-related domain-containing protein [Caballeronia concitans]SAL34838.1 NERD domain-containing protein [Caballeronia concitans]
MRKHDQDRMPTHDLPNETASAADETFSHSRRTRKDATNAAKNRPRVSRALLMRIAPIFQHACDGRAHVRHAIELEHAPGTKNPTTQVDCLAITPFGVFVVNHLHWTGLVKPGTNEDELAVVDDRGDVTIHTSPLRRAKPAVRHLRSVLSQHDCPVESIAVLGEAGGSLHPTVPDGVLTLPDVHYFVRTRLNRFRATHRRYLDVDNLACHIDWLCSRGRSRP